MKRFKAPILGLALLLAGCAAPTASPSPTVTPGSVENLRGLDLAGIKTVEARVSTLRSAVELTGQVNPTETGQASITAPLSGVIVEPLIKAGQWVSKGMPVAVVNSVYGQTSLQLLQKLESDETTLVTARSNLMTARSTLAQAQTSLGTARAAEAQARDNVTQARAELYNAKKDYARKQLLQKGGVFAVSDVDDARERFIKAQSAYQDMVYALKVAKGGVQLAESNVHILRQNLPLMEEGVTLGQANLNRDKSIYHNTQLSGANLPQNLTPVHLEGGGASQDSAADAVSFYIRSPIAGIVTNVTMTANLSVSPGTALAAVVDTSAVYVDGNAFEADLAGIHVGDRLEVKAEAAPQKRFSGHVTYVGKQVDPTARTIPIRTLIQNEGGLLRPSMFVTVRLLSAPRHSAVLIPENAVLIHGTNRSVFVESAPGKFERRSVQVGLISEGQAEIISGVKAGDKVVTDGNLILEGT